MQNYILMGIKNAHKSNYFLKWVNCVCVWGGCQRLNIGQHAYRPVFCHWAPGPVLVSISIKCDFFHRLKSLYGHILLVIYSFGRNFCIGTNLKLHGFCFPRGAEWGRMAKPGSCYCIIQVVLVAFTHASQLAGFTCSRLSGSASGLSLFPVHWWIFAIVLVEVQKADTSHTNIIQVFASAILIQIPPAKSNNLAKIRVERKGQPFPTVRRP